MAAQHSKNETEKLLQENKQQIENFLGIFLFTLLFFLLIITLILYGSKKRNKVKLIR